MAFAFDEKFTKDALQSLKMAQEEAARLNHGYIGTEHLLLGLMRNEASAAASTLSELGLTLGQMRIAVVRVVGRGEQHTARLQLTDQTKEVMKLAIQEARDAGSEMVDTEHLLLALLRLDKSMASAVLESLNINADVVRRRLGARMSQEDPLERFSPGQGRRGRAKKNEESVLEQLSVDLTVKAQNGELDPVIGRETEIERVIQILARRTKNNPALIGEPGVGKTAIVEGLAQRIVDGRVPPDLRRKRLVRLDVGSLVAGTMYRGQFEERLKKVIDEIESTETVLFIDELHMLVGAGSAGSSMDAANILKPALSRGELQCIGATTLDEYRKHIESDAALERRFQPVFVDEPSVDETLEILRGIRDRYEEHHKLTITDEALEAAARLAARYVPDRFLPDKAIDLVDEAAARLRMEIDSSPVEIDEREHRLVQLQIEEQALGQERDEASKERLGRIRQEIADLREELDALRARYERERQAINEVQGDQARLEELRAEAERAERDGNYELAARLRYGDMRELEARLAELEQAARDDEGDLEPMLQQEVTEQDIAQIVSRWTGVPVSRLLEGEVQKLIHMEERLHQRVVGQDEAIRAVSNAVRRARSGLQDPHRPIGSFIFMGPTGVGKTELARALAEFLFDDERAMVRLDMSEYQERHTVARMIGAPPGYVGYDEGGQLTEAVRRRPYAVVLFDELEKAHAEVFNVLLQILDEGRLTDGKGRTVNFSNTVVIMTSNIGSQWISELGGRDDAQMRARVTEALRQRFPPEFLNRIDETIIFHALTREHLAEIVDIQLGHLQQLLAARSLGLRVTPAARQALAAEGYDPVYGARPLRRTIQRRVQDTLALELLQGRFGEGDTVVVDYDDPTYTFHAAESVAAHTMQ